MNAFSLNGDWSLYYLKEGPGIETLEHPGAAFVPAQVPGNVELDLQRTGLLPEPFYADEYPALARLLNVMSGGTSANLTCRRVWAGSALTWFLRVWTRWRRSG